MTTLLLIDDFTSPGHRAHISRSFGSPLGYLVIQLSDTLQMVHEAWQVFKIAPEIVHLLLRSVHSKTRLDMDIASADSPHAVVLLRQDGAIERTGSAGSTIHQIRSEERRVGKEGRF